MGTPRIIVTGASGLLGRAVFNELEATKSLECQGWALNRTRNGLFQKVELTNPKSIETAFNQFKPSIIIHSAAERRPNFISQDYEKSTKLNVGSTAELANLLKQKTLENSPAENKLFIYISTDYVFDGKEPPYTETAVPNPLNDYGKLKLEGEKILATILPADSLVVLRVPILYGPVEYLGEGAVDAVVKSVLSSSSPVPMDNVQVRYPTRVEEVAEALGFLLQHHIQRSNAISGVYQWSGKEQLTKFQMATIAGEAIGAKTDNVVAVNQVPVPSDSTVMRPNNANLATPRIESLGFKVRKPKTFMESAKELYTQFCGEK